MAAARSVICDTCGKALGNPACASCRRAGSSGGRPTAASPAPPERSPAPAARERRDPRQQAPREDGTRASDPRLTTRDVADRLGVSTNFVVEEIQDGRLEALVIRRPGVRTVYRVAEAALEDYFRRFKWTSSGLAERPDPSHHAKR